MIKASRMIGIPVEKVGKRLATINKILEKHDMELGAEATCNINYKYDGTHTVSSVTLTVFMLEEEPIKEVK